MSPVTSPSQVLEAIHRVKTAAPAFCTNLFAAEPKLRDWVAYGELRAQEFEGAAFFARKDRDFSHLYFCAAEPDALARGLARLPIIGSERLAADLVGPEPSLEVLSNRMESAGFRPYSRLVRLSRTANAAALEETDRVELAGKNDAPAILDLLEASFDRFADQLPIRYEIQAAIAQNQMLVVRQDSAIAALLHFETQGFSSVLRFWIVATPFRSAGFGSMLMRHYFASQNRVRRFILWVTAVNENAVKKYSHYGYAPDGLVDQVLVNAMIAP